jgi:hypothetical protein
MPYRDNTDEVWSGFLYHMFKTLKVDQGVSSILTTVVQWCMVRILVSCVICTNCGIRNLVLQEHISAHCLLCSNQLFDFFLLQKSNMVNDVPENDCYVWLNPVSCWRRWSPHSFCMLCKFLYKVVIFRPTKIRKLICVFSAYISYLLGCRCSESGQYPLCLYYCCVI